MRTLLAPLLLPLLFVPAPAQETVTAPSALPLLRIDTQGPAGWRKIFVPTNLGSLLASGEGERLWRPLVSRLEGMLEAMAGKDDYRAARGRLLDYAGEAHAQLWLTPPVEGREPDMVYAVWADADGRTDLGALAAEVTRGLGRLLGESKSEKAGATELTLWRTPGNGWVTTPAVVEGKLRLVASNMSDLAAAMRIAAGTPLPAPSRSSALSVRMDMAAWHQVIKRSAVEESAILELIGLNALDSLAFALGTAGPRVELEMSVAFNAAPRGLIGALLPERSGVPALRHLVPPKCEQWQLTRLDAKAFYLACENLAATFGEGDHKKIREQVKDLGFDPIADLLDHATDEVLLLGDVPLAADSSEERGVDWAIAVRLKDGKAFRKNWDALLGKEDSMLSVQERYEHDGIPVQRYGSMFLPGFHSAVSDHLLVLAFGPEAKARLVALLDADKAPGAAEKQPPLPPLLQEVSRRAPEGLNGMALIDLDTLLGRQVLTILDEAERSILRGVGDVGFDTESVRTAIDQLLPLLRQYNLHRACTISGCAKGRWIFRGYW